VTMQASTSTIPSPAHTQGYDDFIRDWDSVNDGYIYAGAAPEPPGVSFHRDVAEDLDPITYEVVRQGLWSSVDEHATACLRGSGSSIVVIGQDFSPALLTEDAEYVFVAPHVTFLGCASQAAARWTLANRSVDPGIREGDMYLVNDPWICGIHQQDVVLLNPVFVEGKLFCWVSNTMHQYDLGGNTPGSFCAGARDVFDEGVIIPPIKIVEGGKLRTDLEQLYLRQSRMPHLLALDLRAEIAGCTVAARRITHFVEKYGAATVKAVMRRVIDDAEAKFLDRMSRLADGTYSDRGYIEGGEVGSRGSNRLQLNVTKRGSKLIFDNFGTDPQFGCLNSTLAGWRGAILNAVMVTFCFDLQYAIGGPWRHIELRPEPGTMCTARYPASVSNGSNCAIARSIGLACQAISRMLITDPRQKENIFTTSSSVGSAAILSVAGQNQRGEPFGTILTDVMAGGRGAFSFRDGMPTAGLIYNIQSAMPNIEEAEQYMPLLYLYQRELADSGGAGRYTRGNAMEVSLKLHDVDQASVAATMGGVAAPGTPGMYGGYSGISNLAAWHRGTSIEAAFADGRIPQELADLGGERELIPPIALATTWSRPDGDVLQFRISGSAGYGDPFERSTDELQEDADLGYFSEDVLGRVFGAVFVDGLIDAEATGRRRGELRRERLATATDPVRTLVGEPCDSTAPGLSVGELLDIRTDSSGGRFTVCTRCDTSLCTAEEHYKDYAPVLVQATTAISPLQQDPAELLDDPFELRQHFCPGCGALLESEIARADDPPLRETTVQLGA
jgi:N-methylhydantoinase B